MAKQRVDMRLSEDLLGWVDEYAKQRGVSRTALLEGALESFREDAKAGVPELKAQVRSQLYSRETQAELEQGVGVCPKRAPGLGHVWAGVKASGDESNPCRFCGTSGREYFANATAERVELFFKLRAPDSVKGVKSKDRK